MSNEVLVWYRWNSEQNKMMPGMGIYVLCGLLLLYTGDTLSIYIKNLLWCCEAMTKFSDELQDQ